MTEFIKIQYLLRKINAERVLSYVPKWLTAEEAEMIIGNKAV